ncbi:MAG: phasin family protein [Alphaproteobacteria bacterium]|nr:phasin family protein [Alphaproteobacteria bacterium]
MIKGIEDFQKLSESSMDITLKNFGEMAKSFQIITAEFAASSKRNIDRSAASAEKVLKAGTIDKAFEAQVDYFRSSCEDALSQMNKIFEISMDAARDVYKPLMSVPAASTAVSKSSKS